MATVLAATAPALLRADIPPRRPGEEPATPPPETQGPGTGALVIGVVVAIAVAAALLLRKPAPTPPSTPAR